MCCPSASDSCRSASHPDWGARGLPAYLCHQLQACAPHATSANISLLQQGLRGVLRFCPVCLVSAAHQTSMRFCGPYSRLQSGSLSSAGWDACCPPVQSDSVGLRSRVQDRTVLNAYAACCLAISAPIRQTLWLQGVPTTPLALTPTKNSGDRSLICARRRTCSPSSMWHTVSEGCLHQDATLPAEGSQDVSLSALEIF